MLNAHLAFSRRVGNFGLWIELVLYERLQENFGLWIDKLYCMKDCEKIFTVCCIYCTICYWNWVSGTGCL
jgi:hypothetical protein